MPQPGKSVPARAKHGTRTAEGQKRQATRKKARAVDAGLVDEDASRRDVDAAIKAARIDFMRSDAKSWDDVRDELVHVADAFGSITQAGVIPTPTMALQLPMAYAHIFPELAQYGGGPVFVRFYKQRPIPAHPAVGRALDELERLSG